MTAAVTDLWEDYLTASRPDNGDNTGGIEFYDIEGMNDAAHSMFESLRALSAANEDAYLRGFSAGAKVPNSGAFTVIDNPELASLRDALTASLAETAAAYEVAAQVVDLRASFYAAKRDSDDTEIEMHLVLIEVVEAHGYAASAIRAITPADCKAALDRMIAGIIMDAQLRCIERGRLDTPDEIRAAAIPKGGDK